MSKLPKEALQALHDEGVSDVKYFEAPTPNIILIQTNKGTYAYTDTLYSKGDHRNNPWRRCSDNTLHESIF